MAKTIILIENLLPTLSFWESISKVPGTKRCLLKDARCKRLLTWISLHREIQSLLLHNRNKFQISVNRIRLVISLFLLPSSSFVGLTLCSWPMYERIFGHNSLFRHVVLHFTPFVLFLNSVSFGEDMTLFSTYYWQRMENIEDRA